MKMIKRLPPILLAMLIQLVAFGICRLVDTYGGQEVTLSAFNWALIQGALAAVMTLLSRMSYWWIGIQLVFAPLLILGLAFEIPLWIFPLTLVVLLMVFWNVAINRVPLYLTNTKTTDKLLSLLPKEQGGRFADLGCGLAGTLVTLAKARPDMEFHGFETAPVPFMISKLRALLAGASNVHIHFVSLWVANLSHFDRVYCFLSPVPMPDLYLKARDEMPKGSLFISNSFTVPNIKPSRTVNVQDGRKTKLFIWKM